MKRKTLSLFLLVALLAAGCGLDTSGVWSPMVWIDSPLNGAFLLVDTAAAIMGHTDIHPRRMVLNVDGVPVVSLTVVEVSGSLWEAAGYWTPAMPGRYALSISAQSSTGYYRSSEIGVIVVEERSSPMLQATPTAEATPAASPTAWPAAQVNFYADSPIITLGGCTDLHWEANYVTAVYLNSEYVAQIGSRRVCPQNTTVYTLNVQAPAGNVDRQLTITVEQPTVYAPPPAIVTTPPDTDGPELTNLSHSPEAVFDNPTCGSVDATISVKVSDASGISAVVLYYRAVRGASQGSWRQVSMNHTGGKNYQAVLGPAELGASLSNYGGGIVEYYVQARDSRGNMTQSGTRSFEAQICLI